MRRKITCAAVALPMLLVAGDSQRAGNPVDVAPGELKGFVPLPEAVPGRSGVSAKDQVELGRMLYFDPRLSKSQTISCNTCHPLPQSGVAGGGPSGGVTGG